MTFLIDKDEGTAARRRVPFRLFTSNGTAPDTGASNDTFLLSVNGGAQFSGGSLSAISAAAGMYYGELSASNVSVLGSIAVWYDLGDFAQHVANVQVVNFNPMSSFSNIAAKAYSGVTVGAGDITPNTYSGVTVGIDDIAAGTYSGVTVGTGDIALGTYSGVTVGINDIAPGAYSGVSVEVTTAGIQTASFAAGAIDAAALATDAGAEIADAVLDRNMATGSDSGSSAVRTLRDAARAIRNRVVSDATQIYVYQEDDTTIKWTASISTVASTNAHISAMDPNS